MNLFYDVGTMKSLLCILFFAAMVIVAILDLYKTKIPDIVCLFIFMLGAISIFFIKDIALWERFLGVIAVSLPMLLMTMFFKRGFGGGDIKLMAATGMFLGVKLTIVGALLGLVFTAIYILISMVTGNRRIYSGIPLGPGFAIGMIISCIFGSYIWNFIF